MKKTMFAVAAAALLAAPMTVRAQAADSRPTVAVLPFANASIEPTYAPLTKGFQAIMLTTLGANPNVRIVERDEIQRILDEQKLGTAGQLDPATIIRVGKILGAKYMIAGTYTTSPDKVMRFDIRAFNTETSEIIYTDGTAKGPSNKMMDLIAQAAATANTKLKLPALPPAGPAREAANAKIEQQKKLPIATVMLYARAMEAKDAGKTSEARTLFSQVLDKMPGYEPAQAELAKLPK